jgi:hypothetical protein
MIVYISQFLYLSRIFKKKAKKVKKNYASGYTGPWACGEDPAVPARGERDGG